MYRVGQRIFLRKYSPSDNISSERFKIGQSFIIIRISFNLNLVYIANPFVSRANEWYLPFSIIGSSKELKTEIEYLNAFQDNFREGI